MVLAHGADRGIKCVIHALLYMRKEEKKDHYFQNKDREKEILLMVQMVGIPDRNCRNGNGTEVHQTDQRKRFDRKEEKETPEKIRKHEIRINDVYIVNLTGKEKDYRQKRKYVCNQNRDKVKLSGGVTGFVPKEQDEKCKKNQNN